VNGPQRQTLVTNGESRRSASIACGTVRVSMDAASTSDQPVTARARCQHRGCANPPTVGCHYVDSGGRLCVTSWCEDHRARAGLIPYCRRHASIVRARETGRLRGPLPRIDNRAPALVAFVSDAVEAPIRRLFESLAAQRHETVVSSRAVELVSEPQLRWQQSWALQGEHGDSLRLTIAVDEATDPEMLVTINRRQIRFVPPWITRRRERIELAPPMDADERRAFYNDLVEHITGEIRRQLEG
jgi:hypothetical protein